MSQPDPVDPPPRSFRPVGAYLTFVMAVGSFPTFAIGALAPFIVRDLHLSLAALGSVTTGMLLVATVASPLAGVVSDRLPSRELAAGVLVVATVSTIGMAAAPTIGWLVAAGCIYGLTTAAALPVTNRSVAWTIPVASRGRVMAAKASGVQVGALLAGLALPPLALVVGWRGSFLASATVVIVGTLWGRTVMARGVLPKDPVVVASRGAKSLVTQLAGYAVFMGFAVSATATYLVLYGVEALGLHEASAGLAAAAIGLAGIASRLLWTELSERARAAYGILLVLPLGGVCSVASLWAAERFGVAYFWVGAFGFGATVVAWNAVANLALITSTPGAVSGRVSGIMQAGFYGGYALAPVSVGVLLDRTASYQLAWVTIAAGLAAAALWLAGWGWVNRRRGWSLSS